MRLPIMTQKRHQRLLTEAVQAEFIRVSSVRAEPLTRGWAVELNYNIYFAPDSRLRGLVTAALQDAAGKAMRPGAGEMDIKARPLGPIAGLPTSGSMEGPKIPTDRSPASFGFPVNV